MDEQILLKDINHIIGCKKRGGVKYVCHMNTTGYSVAARGYIAALVFAGYDVTVTTIGNVKPIVDDNINNKIAYYCYNRKISYDKVIIHTVPDDFQRYIEKDCKNYGLTVWESSELPDEWIPMLKIPYAIIVPCSWNKDIFSKNIKRVGVVHHVINYKKVPPLKIAGDKFMFYTIGEWCKRKNLDKLISTFNSLFANKKDVVLYVKTFSFPSILSKDNAEKLWNNYRSDKVIINSDKVDDDFISALHERGDVYVSYSAGEGVGLGSAEAAKHGNVVIAPNYGGHKDYLKGLYLTKYKEIPCDPCDKYHKHCKDDCKHYVWYDKNKQSWAEPDLEDMKRFMTKAYNEKRGKEMNLFMEENFSHSAIAQQFVKILEK